MPDALSWENGALWGPDPTDLFPFVAYYQVIRHGADYNASTFEIFPDECASTNLSRTLSKLNNGAFSLTSVIKNEDPPDYRMRAVGEMTRASANDVIDNLAAAQIFRFRDVVTVQAESTVQLELIVQMDGAMSIVRLDKIPPELPARRVLKVIAQEVTACTLPVKQLAYIIDEAPPNKPDVLRTNVFSVCSNSVVRLDILVELNAGISRFTTIGDQVVMGGKAYADFSQCMNGNNVCYEDCLESELSNCTGFGVRLRVAEPPGAARALAQGAKAQLHSAGGFDYAAPLTRSRPRVFIAQDTSGATLTWPSSANEYEMTWSENLEDWKTLGTVAEVDLEKMLYRLNVPTTERKQYFRLSQVP